LSYLREIMIRLKERSAAAAASDPSHHPVADDASAPGEDQTPSPELTPGIETHIRQYRDNLRHCSDAMLRYEWAWLEEHLSSLNLSSGHAEMRQALGGRGSVETLLLESAAFQEQLQQEMDERGLTPANRTGPLVPLEHAWEVSNDAILQAWDIEPSS
jgi:hypothetical protein